jgi:hypothetical protein
MLFARRPNFVKVALSTKKKLSKHMLMACVVLNVDYHLTLTGCKIFVLLSGMWLIMEALCFCASGCGMSVFGFKVILFPERTVCTCIVKFCLASDDDHLCTDLF